ncbi:3'-5' exonuclease [Sphingomonas corticis]|uniref:DNA polymerase III subunit epsilon n=1 Tax=Sphingomonas corticis TaxID=2722791 RepID=A0ABX1CMH9_9SPHN|nr:DNA polymerase III subunit epsilon [Sphingomonas corticis]
MAEAVQSDVEAARRLLAADGRFRVLERVALPDGRVPLGPIAGSKIGICLDTETTGLDPAVDSVIELALRRFRFTADGKIVALDAPFAWLEDPGAPLDPVVSRLTGLTDADLAGRVIDGDAATTLLLSASLVVAHNSRFDRPFVEGRLPAVAGLRWSCSMEEVDWAGAGYEGRALRWLLDQAGWFYAAHRAGDDVDALIELLRHQFGDGSTVLSHVLAGADRCGWLVRADGAHFDRKDVLRQRGYFWNGSAKVWMREVGDEALGDEREWLDREVYAHGHRARASGPVVSRVDAGSRYRRLN